MDKKEGSSTNFMPDDLLEIICILERGEKHNPYKIICKRNYFSLITKFPAKNGESTPLKNCASARGTATHQDKREFSSDDKLPNKRRKRRRNKSSHASRSASQQKDKKLKESSDVRLAQQKRKKKSSEISLGRGQKKTVQMILQEFFKDEKTKINNEALELMTELITVFVEEAVSRTSRQAQKDGTTELSLEQFEKILPQLLLDI